MPLWLRLHVLGGRVWALGTAKCSPSSETLLSLPISLSGRPESRCPGKSRIRVSPMALFLAAKEFWVLFQRFVWTWRGRAWTHSEDSSRRSRCQNGIRCAKDLLGRERSTHDGKRRDCMSKYGQLPHCDVSSSCTRREERKEGQMGGL